MLLSNRGPSVHTPGARRDPGKKRVGGSGIGIGTGSTENIKREIWSSLLDSVASGKRLPEKHIIVLGGSPDSQKDFVESLSPELPGSRGRLERRLDTQPPLANKYALGYTYHDVLDADHEDLLARLPLHFLSEPSLEFIQLLKPLLNNPRTISNTLVVVLLDWTEPWLWIRQLHSWIRLLRELLESLDDECHDVMTELMTSWQKKGRGGGGGGAGGAYQSEAGSGGGKEGTGEVSMPLGPGEWDDPLGLPLCVVCQHVSLTIYLPQEFDTQASHATHMDYLARERSWRESDFDFVQLHLRTILLKHGASLIYTSPSPTTSLPTLLHSLLQISSPLLKRHSLKHNVIDRDRVLIPPNWDSWGKIQALDPKFDVERVNKGWMADLAQQNRPSSSDDHHPRSVSRPDGEVGVQQKDNEGEDQKQQSQSAIKVYEHLIPDFSRRDGILGPSIPPPSSTSGTGPTPQLSVITGGGGVVSPNDTTTTATTTEDKFKEGEPEGVDTQAFLASQLEVLERMRMDEEEMLSSSAPGPGQEGASPTTPTPITNINRNRNDDANGDGNAS
ncbi:MAG: Phosphatidylinositol 3,5-bisphosphate-binding protein [Watsoniomyces obsoletus]|nr:MAG: Phosphatidylinositol 3,5-bisphosphate-binding protein [Watsoniomyces obsoletus]